MFTDWNLLSHIRDIAMRILHIITSLRTGGAEKLMVDLLPRLQRMNNDIEILLFDGIRTTFFDKLESQGIKIHKLDYGKNVYNPILLIKLFIFLLKNKFDIVHTHNTACQLFTAIVSIFFSFRLITTEHNTTNRRRNLKWYKLIDKWMYHRYDDVICISKIAENNLRKYLCSNDDKIITIQNGIDIDTYSNAQPFNRTNDKQIIVMVAGFRKEKDQDTLIKALSLLPKDQFELWLVGDGERKELLKTLVYSKGLENNVVFWGIRNDVPSILKSADIIVMSSHSEGLSLSNLEGMASGKPLIASDVDGLREITQNYGLLFEHGNSIDLADKITLLSTDKNLYQEVAKNCYRRACQFDINEMSITYNNIYNKSYYNS